MTDLLPCPFCGQVPIVFGPTATRHVISCSNDDCIGPHTTAMFLDDAVYQWNKRSVMPTPPQSPVWQPIDTAPKGRDDLFDVWCISPDEGESDMTTRLTDVFWYEADEIVPHTGWARITDDGNIDFVEQESSGPCGLPAWKPVFWMPRPASPLSRPHQPPTQER